MASDYKYLLTEKARSDFDGIIRYIAIELSSPKAASDFADELQEKINETLLFPESGANVNNEYLAEKNVRSKLVGNYIMFYLPDKEKRLIYVLRIVYGRMNLNDIIREMNIPK